ncbi:MAG: SLC13 family permease [Alphaproteobacteria bacterium]|nr:SLC13 family permease [Alphaproteobacteria bacterium]MDD9920632.1 SLC13 family permease [Alphaproteobacteria bacterium]
MPEIQLLNVLILTLIVAGSLILFVMDKYPIDGIAFVVLLALLLTGLVLPKDILTGFSNPATMTVAAMFVLSAGLQRTGIVRLLAHQLYRLAGKSRQPFRLSAVMGFSTGFLSAFVNNTATVSVLLPVTLRLCRERGISPTRVLLTLSFAAQFGGVCTLIGTTTNLLVNAYAIEAGYPSFSLFEFGKLGLICFGVGMVYMLIVSQFILPNRQKADDAIAAYNLKDYVTEMKVLPNSPLIGQTGGENALHDISDDLQVLQIIRDGQRVWSPQSTQIREDDLLMIHGSVDRVLDAVGRLKLDDWAEKTLSEAHLSSEDIAMVEVLIPRGSRLIGRTLNQLDFYWRYHAAVLAIRHAGIEQRLADIPFQEGDMLLLQGHKDDIKVLQEQQDFMFLQDLSTMRVKKKRAWFAVLWMAFFLGSVGIGALPVLTAAFVSAAGMVMCRCLSLQEAYKSINLPIIMLLAGLIPMGHAMQSTGTADLIANTILTSLGDWGALALLAGIYAITMVLTAIMSNTATAALLAPLAIGLASTLGVSPTPFLVAVAFAASTCFTTPVGYQTNMMVYTPGGYKYMDFIKIGLPLNIIFMALSVLLIPYFWPF